MNDGPRVLMTADAVGGVWRYAVDLGAALHDRGVRTTIAVMGPPPDADQQAEALAAGLEIVHRPFRLEWMDEPWDDVARAGEWLLALERELRPSLVHLNGYAHAALPWRAPVLVVAHSCVRTWWRAVKGTAPPRRLDRYSEAVAAGLHAAQIVVAPTAAMADGIMAEYAGTFSVRVIPNGRPGAPAGDDVWASKMNVVLAAGRVWDEAKNIVALAAIADSVDWPVYVAGPPDAPDGGRSPLAGVHLLGRVSAHRLGGWYRSASIYALPARYEPFGLSVLEAAAAGDALILGDIPTLRENWGDAALFVAPDDAEALLAALCRLIASRDERAALARRARARAAALTIDRTADEYLQLYQTLIA